MKKLTCIAVAVAACALLLTEFSYAQGWGWGGGMGRGMGRGLGMWGAGFGNVAAYPNANVYPYANVPDLTQDQINRINEIQVQFQVENQALLNSLNQKNYELQNLMMVQPPDHQAVDAKIDEIYKIQAELDKKELASTGKIQNIYTPKQKAVLNANTMGYAGSVNPYGMGLGAGFGGGYSSGYGVYGNRNAFGGVRLGRGPCGMGLAKTGRWYPY